MSEKDNGKKSKKTSLVEFGEHEENPFIAEIIKQQWVEAKRTKVKKHKNIIEAETGTSYVIPADSHDEFYWRDDRPFNKVYMEFIDTVRNLSGPASQMFWFIMSRLKPNKDVVIIKPAEFIAYMKIKARSQYYVAAYELCLKRVIVPTTAKFHFYINPVILFNGDVTKLLPQAKEYFLQRLSADSNKSLRGKGGKADLTELQKKMDEKK